MAYLGLETQKPAKPLKKKSTYIFPKTSADQIVVDESTDKRLPETLAEVNEAIADHSGNTSNPHGVTKSQVGLSNVDNNKQMPIAGGTFTGNATAYETARTTRGIFNEETRASSTTGTLQSVKYFINVT